MEATNIWLHLCLLIILVSTYGNIQTCRPVSLADVRVAARASKEVYYNTISMNNYIPGTSFKVVNIKTTHVGGESLKAIVATFRSTSLICFRGTATSQQLLQQLKSALAPQKRLPYPGTRMHVMPYFWYAFLMFSPDTLVPDGIQHGGKYIITGHSLGGALASLFALHLRMKHGSVWENSQSSLITFGAPRVGDRNYAAWHDALISKDRKLRFVYRHDIVPRIPTPPRYYHHSREIWIWKKAVIGWWWKTTWKTYWTVCNAGDNPSSCSSSSTHAELFSHDIRRYLSAILSHPNKYYDRHGRSRRSFADAQCR